MTPNVTHLVALSVVLLGGVGGALAAAYLGAPDLATGILAMSGGLFTGLVSPQLKLTKDAS